MSRHNKSFRLEKFGIYMIDLPTQFVTVPNGSQSAKIEGMELNGIHPAVVVSVASNGRSALVAPLTSAKDARGGEKFQVVPKEWLRVLHQKPSYILLEQLRCVDRARFIRAEEHLAEYDQDQLESRLKLILGLV